MAVETAEERRPGTASAGNSKLIAAAAGPGRAAAAAEAVAVAASTGAAVADTAGTVAGEPLREGHPRMTVASSCRFWPFV